MNARKKNLMDNLQIVISGLKNNTIHHNWLRQESCNCGVVAQAILGIGPLKLKEYFVETNMFKRNVLASYSGMKESEVHMTWQNAVKAYCPITGEPLITVFKKLRDAGLTSDDIVHLEHMTNPIILKRAAIPMEIKKVFKVKTGTNTVKSKTFFGKLFNKSSEEPVYEQQERMVQDHDYYTRPQNLIKYLTAWVQILKEGENTTVSAEFDIEGATVSDLDNMESELINVLAEEKYERAAKLRDKINEIRIINKV